MTKQLIAIDFNSMEKYTQWKSMATVNSYRFGSTWGRVNDDSIFILEWTIPLSTSVCVRVCVYHSLREYNDLDKTDETEDQQRTGHITSEPIIYFLRVLETRPKI